MGRSLRSAYIRDAGVRTAGAFEVFRGEYSVNLFMEKSSLPLRAELPMVGPLMTLTLLALVGAVGLFTLDHFKRDEKAREWGWRMFHGAMVLQALVLIVFAFQMKNLDNPSARVPAREYRRSACGCRSRPGKASILKMHKDGFSRTREA